VGVCVANKGDHGTHVFAEIWLRWCWN